MIIMKYELTCFINMHVSPRQLGTAVCVYCYGVGDWLVANACN